MYSPLDQQILQTSIQGDRFEIIGGRLAERHGTARRACRRSAPGWSRTTRSLTGKHFDIAHTSLEVQDHKQDIEDVHHEQEGGLNRSVIAHHDLPTLRTHLHLSKLAFWASLKK